MNENSKIFRLRGIVENERGVVLIAALTLLTALLILGTTAYILSSTDIKIGANFRNNQMVLQVAMAGAERARRQLNLDLFPASGAVVSLSAELASKKGANNVLDGYVATTDDVALANGSLNGASYVAYLTNDAQDTNGQYSTMDSNNKVLITSVATGPNSSKAKVELIFAAYTGLASSPATVYSKGDVTGNGSSLTVSGNDSCNGGTSLAPIYTMDPATTHLDGHPNLSGSPSSPEHGPTNVDIAGTVDALKANATTILYADTNDAAYGSSSNYVTVYSWPDDPNHYNNQGLTLSNVTGYGILLVKGDLTLGGGFNWNGIILATGSVTLNGGGGAGININGLIFTGTSTLTDVSINGSDTIRYDSCKVKSALTSGGAKVVSWKQLY